MNARARTHTRIPIHARTYTNAHAATRTYSQSADSPISVLISVIPWTLSMSASSELGSGRHPKTSDEALRLEARVLRLFRGVVVEPLVKTEGETPR